MSRLIKCENGHFYDADKWEHCPNCNNTFRMRVKKQDDIGDMNTVRYGQMGGIPGERPAFPPYGKEPQENKKPMRQIAGSDDETVAIHPKKEKFELSRDSVGNVVWNEAEDEKTVSIFTPTRKLVCGWLVVVAGPNKGKDYRICEGRNLIGRDFSMDIVIKEDKMISRDNHCSIVYDRRKNQTWIAMGSGSLTYVNGELLRGQKVLKTGDVVEAGQTKFMYVAFCEGERSWDQLG